MNKEKIEKLISYMWENRLSADGKWKLEKYIIDLQSKLNKIKVHIENQKSIMREQPSKDKEIDDYYIARLDGILSIIGSD